MYTTEKDYSILETIMNAPPNAKRKQAFTLIELLVVIAIIAILMAITLGIAGAVNRSAAESKARAEIANLVLELEAYKSDRGIYPADLVKFLEWYKDKYANTLYTITDVGTFRKGSGPSTEYYQAPADPWGNEFYYKPINDFVFRLGSKGPDQRFGSTGMHNSEISFGKGDDISSQK